MTIQKVLVVVMFYSLETGFLSLLYIPLFFSLSTIPSLQVTLDYNFSSGVTVSPIKNYISNFIDVR